MRRTVPDSAYPLQVMKLMTWLRTAYNNPGNLTFSDTYELLELVLYAGANDTLNKILEFSLPVKLAHYHPNSTKNILSCAVSESLVLACKGINEGPDNKWRCVKQAMDSLLLAVRNTPASLTNKRTNLLLRGSNHKGFCGICLCCPPEFTYLSHQHLTPLTYACCTGDAKLVQRLIIAGEDLNDTSSCWSRQLKCKQDTLGTCWNLANIMFEEVSPLAVAVSYLEEDVVKMMLRAGARPSNAAFKVTRPARYRHKMSLVALAVQCRRHAGVLNVLLKATPWSCLTKPCSILTMHDFASLCLWTVPRMLRLTPLQTSLRHTVGTEARLLLKFGASFEDLATWCRQFRRSRGFRRSLMQGHRGTPSNLVHISRMAVRRHLTEPMYSQVKKLGIPKTLERYVMFDDES